jgi:hypothetical protein
MKRTLSFLPLLGLSPLGSFLGEYLDGAGVLPRGSGLLVGGFCAFILPWVVAAAFALIARTTWTVRLLLFICALVAQPVLFFILTPPGATSEMMGIAHRLSREFPPDQMRDCAGRLRQKHHDGTLTVRRRDSGHSFLMSESAVMVDDSELPVSLRGRFDRVFIQQDRVTGDEQVFFSLGEETGIVCDSRKHVREFFVCSMAEGVHAYRYQRL